MRQRSYFGGFPYSENGRRVLRAWLRESAIALPLFVGVPRNEPSLSRADAW